MNDFRRIADMCYNDRKAALEKVRIGWLKKNGLDLLVKYFIVMINSTGISNIQSMKYIFVDEVNNNNMRNNLVETMYQFQNYGEKVGLISFYRGCIGKNCIKFGFLNPIKELVYLSFLCIPIFFKILFGVCQDKQVITLLTKRYTQFLKNTLKENVSEIYLMTDYNFFSTIIAMQCSEKCSVMQHGLLMDTRFYYPIRAGRFLAWSEHSKEIQKFDKKVEIVGTYKFLKMKKNDVFCTRFNKVLFCIGSLEKQIVKEKIDVLKEIAMDNNLELLVKCHPGSLFDLQYWKDLYKGCNIEFYKNELIQNIDFDIAVTETSTVILDLISLNKPFILFDECGGYFSEYEGLIPRGTTKEKLESILRQIDTINFEHIIAELKRRELNNGNCIIYEKRKV